MSLWSGLLVLMIATVTSTGYTIESWRENSASTSSRGRTFFVAFTETIEVAAQLELYLSCYDTPCMVRITVPSPSYNETALIAKNSSIALIIPSEYMLREGELSRKLVTVRSDADISLIAFNSSPQTADALVCLPQHDLGTEYYIFTPGRGHSNQFAVGNGEDKETQVDITVATSLIFNEITYNKTQTLSVTLAPQQVILFGSTSDLTGTRVKSSTAVAVFSGNKCYWSLTGSCDIIIEQLFPVQSWGQTFVAFPVMTKKERDSIHIIAARSNTTVDVLRNGRTTQYYLEPGSSVKVDLVDPVLVNSTKPIMVAYLFVGNLSPLGFPFDPFLMTVPPTSFTGRYYKFVTKEDYYNYLFIASHSSLLSEFLLDHSPLTENIVATRYLEGFTGWEVELGKIAGPHEIYHPSETFGIYVFGVENYVSYGYSLGQASLFSGPQEPEVPEEPGETPELTCLAHHAEYRLPVNLLTDADLSIDDVHLNSPECGARQEGQWAVITVPFDKCGSQVLVEDGKTVYANTIYGSIQNSTVHRIEVPLRCEMVDNEALSLQFHPTVNDKVAVGHHNLSLGFYRSGTFNDPVTVFPYEVDLHGNLYVEFKVESDDDDLQIHTERCTSSPSLSPAAESHSLLEHGCPQDSTLHAFPSSDQRVQHFGFHVFKFGDSPEVYLLCDVIICHNDSSPNRCTQGCSNPRHKRDLRSSGTHLQTARLSQGPIIFNRGYNLKAGAHREEQNLSTNVILIGALCGIAVLASMALIVQRRYYRSRSPGYMILQGREDSSCH